MKRPTASESLFRSANYKARLTNFRYLPGLYDPDTNTLTLTTAPLYLMSHRAKRLKTMPLPSQAARMEMAEYRAKKNDLGEVFGTRKAKSQIRAAERGKVNAAAMEGVRDHLMESIPVSEVIESELQTMSFPLSSMELMLSRGRET